jgi:hypothetical protein
MFGMSPPFERRSNRVLCAFWALAMNAPALSKADANQSADANCAMMKE